MIYSYDLVGNRLSSLGVSPYQYNSSNQLTSIPNVSYTYDNNGNTKTKTDASGVTTYNWDFENRLSSVVLPGSGGTVSFKYDPFGRRVQKSSTTGTTTDYVYDGANILEEVDNNGSVLMRYTQGPGIDQPLAQLRSGTTSYYQQDGLSSVTSLSSSTGVLANTYTYDSFGKLTASTGSVINTFRYTGRESDSETGLYYYRARYYDAGTGRFQGEDPIRFQGGIDFYRYALNAPVNFKDPLGLTARCYYAQNTGHLICYDDTTAQQIVNIYNGYAGGNEGKSPECVNNSRCQYQHDVGPLPWGDYRIGQANNRRGPLSLPLTPIPGTNTWGRSGFYMHGDNSCQCQSGSQGCIVVPLAARRAINDAGGGIVEVSPTDPDLSPGSACTGGVCRN